MTAADHLKTIREQHHSTVRHWFKHSTTDCAQCLTRWPCDASRLLDAVEKVLEVERRTKQIAADTTYSEGYLDGWNHARSAFRRAIATALEGK